MLFPERLRRISRRTRVVVAALIVVAVGGDRRGVHRRRWPGRAAGCARSSRIPPPSFDDIPVVTLPDGFVQPDTRGVRLSPVVAQPKGGRTRPARVRR